MRVVFRLTGLVLCLWLSSCLSPGGQPTAPDPLFSTVEAQKPDDRMSQAELLFALMRYADRLAADVDRAATAMQTGGKIYTLNKKHYPMPDILVDQAW